MSITIKSVSAYEIGNGIEVRAENNGENYRVYLQLPETGDSQHSDLDGNCSDEEIEEIVQLVEEKYTSLGLSLLEKTGELGIECLEFTPQGCSRSYYVIVDSDGQRQYFRESNYADYYSKTLIDYLSISDLSDENLMNQLDTVTL